MAKSAAGSKNKRTQAARADRDKLYGLHVFNSTFSENRGIEVSGEGGGRGCRHRQHRRGGDHRQQHVRRQSRPNTGGAIHNSEPTAEVTLINCTSSAAAGGGTISTERSGAITLRNTLLAANLGDRCNVGATGRILDGGGNLDDADVKLRLTKRGRQFVSTGKKKRIKGVMEIRNDTGTSIAKSTRVKLRIKRR